MFPQSLQTWRPDPLHLVEPGSPCRAVPLRAPVRSHGHNNSQDLLKRLTLQGWPRVALPLFFSFGCVAIFMTVLSSISNAFRFCVILKQLPIGAVSKPTT